MKSLKAEQAAVIKFLTLEGCAQRQIFQRLKTVFGNFTIPRQKVYRLHLQYLRKGLLGLAEEPPYMEVCQSERKSSEICTFSDAEINEVEDIKIEVPFDEESPELEESGLCEVEEETNKKLKSNMSVKEATIPKDDVKDEVSLNPLSNPSIFKSDIEALTAISRKQRSCHLCQGRVFGIPSILRRHFQRLHLNHKVRVGRYLCLLCRCGCAEPSFLRSHYHCPICSVVTQKTRLAKHFQQHYIVNRLHLEDDFEECRRNMENAKKARSICIDPSIGLYLVPKTDREPTHVIQRTENGKLVARCSETLCESAMLKGRKNGKLDLKCKHILRADIEGIECAELTSIFSDIVDSPSMLLEGNDQHLCSYIIKGGLKRNVCPVVEWFPKEGDVSFYSVFCDASYANFGRLVVKYDAETKAFHCACPLSKDNSALCPYARVCQLYQKFAFRA